MPVYEYTALDIKGKTITGIIDSDNPFSARQNLRTSKIYPVSIKEVHDTPTKKESLFFSLIRPFTRVRTSEISMMTRQLSTLIGAGFQLVSAINTLIPQTKSYTFKKILAQIKDSIVEGKSFANALSQYPWIFSSLYVNMVHSGESSGTLEIVLERLADISEKQQALKNRIRSSLAYPIFMSFIGTAVLFLLLAYIVPSITSIFTDMNQVLPVPTRFLITISDIFKSYWWIFFIVIIGSLLIFHILKKTAAGLYFFDKTILYLPGIGILAKKLAVSRFSRTLGSLLENGVSMLSALEIVKNIVGNVLISDAIETAAKEVSKGHGLSAAFSESGLFPNLSIQMIQVGE